MNKQTVTINGRQYDVHTGMPVDIMAPKPQRQSRPHPSQAVHQTTQKSQTLNRHVVKKAGPSVVKQHAQSKVRPDIARHPSVSKFATHPSGVAPKSSVTTPEPAHVPHPVVQKAHLRHEQRKAASAPQPVAMVPKPSKVIKEEAIQEAMAKAPSHSANHHEVKQKRRLPRIMSVASASLALLLLGGYFTYLNMPSLSVRVAAAQAGVDASYPSYHPDGYSLKGPVAYSDGQVTMKFASNAGPQNFTVAQEKTSWDSSAVLENYVKDKAGENYITYDERGLTIYTFGGNAAWVNGGVLYTINGDAPLSGDQIRHIATSM